MGNLANSQQKRGVPFWCNCDSDCDLIDKDDAASNRLPTEVAESTQLHLPAFHLIASSLDSLTQEYSKISDNEPALGYMRLVVQTSTCSREITLSPLGYVSSNRTCFDGNAYFGYSGTEIDVFLDASEELREKYQGKLFVVAYDWGTNAYYIKDLGVGMGTFFKVRGPITIRQNLMVHFNDKFIVFSMKKDLRNPGFLANVFEKDEETVSFTFCVKEYANRVILIGRSKTCDLHINDLSVSKVQASIYYLKGRWMLIDGKYLGGTKSTNGTWAYLDEYLKITQNTVFKSGNTLFQVNLFYQPN